MKDYRAYTKEVVKNTDGVVAIFDARHNKTNITKVNEDVFIVECYQITEDLLEEVVRSVRCEAIVLMDIGTVDRNISEPSRVKVRKLNEWNTTGVKIYCFNNNSVSDNKSKEDSTIRLVRTYRSLSGKRIRSSDN